MPKSLEYSELSLGERRGIEAVVGRYRANRMSRAELQRQLRMLGYDAASVERYAGLLDSTLDHEPPYRRPAPVTPWWQTASGWYDPLPYPRMASGRR
jgi:hypothetical protein